MGSTQGRSALRSDQPWALVRNPFGIQSTPIGKARTIEKTLGLQHPGWVRAALRPTLGSLPGSLWDSIHRPAQSKLLTRPLAISRGDEPAAFPACQFPSRGRAHLPFRGRTHIAATADRSAVQKAVMSHRSPKGHQAAELLERPAPFAKKVCTNCPHSIRNFTFVGV